MGRGGGGLRQAWTDQKRKSWQIWISNFFFFAPKCSLDLGELLLPSFSAVLQLEVEEEGEERTIILIHSAAPSPVVVPDKKSPHVPNMQQGNARLLSRMLSPCMWLYDLGSLTSKRKRCSLLNTAQVVVGEAVTIWPGAGRCHRTIADVDEPSKKRQQFIFGVPCVRLLSDNED